MRDWARRWRLHGRPTLEEVAEAVARFLREGGVADPAPRPAPRGALEWVFATERAVVRLRVGEAEGEGSEPWGQVSAFLAELPDGDEENRILPLYRRMLELNFEQVADGSLGVCSRFLVYDVVFSVGPEQLRALGPSLRGLADRANAFAEELVEGFGARALEGDLPDGL